MADLAGLVLGHELAGKGRTVRPQIGVLVSWEQLVALAGTAPGRPEGHDGSGPRRSPSFATPALVTGDAIAAGRQFEDGTPIPRILLDRLSCDSGLRRFVFGPLSEVLDVGRAERTFSGPRRAAIIARDKHCRFPGCTAPAFLCECHHTVHWARDHGSTAVADGILLCTFHHDLVHRTGIEIRRRRDAWAFTDRHGRPITADHHRISMRL